MEVEMTREKTFNMRLSEEETQQFERVASHYALPVASMLRMLVREKDLQIARDAQALVAGGVVSTDDAKRWSRIRARAKTEEQTGVSFAFPTWLRATFLEVSHGGSRGFKDAGYRVAGAFYRLVEGSEEAEQAIEHMLESDNPQPLEFVRQFLPRVYEKVPKNRREAFTAGMLQAIEEGEVTQ